jgi:hypothetical protein
MKHVDIRAQVLVLHDETPEHLVVVERGAERAEVPVWPELVWDEVVVGAPETEENVELEELALVLIAWCAHGGALGGPVSPDDCVAWARPGDVLAAWLRFVQDAPSEPIPNRFFDL